MGIRVGIDLGTTFSAVARINPLSGKPEVIKNSFGKPITPSVLCFEENGSILYGEDAKNMQAMGNTNTVSFFKRSMGDDMFVMDIFGKQYTPTDFSSILLKKLKEEAEKQVGETIEAAVITVPAYFAHKERCATFEAGNKAGINVISIINEPTAAALAYGLNDVSKDKTVLIYDLGGGTFDVTVARITSDDVNILGSDGNHELGGKDWDDCIARYISEQFYEKYGVDLTESHEMIESVLVMAEDVKKKLTSVDKVNVPIVYNKIRGTVEITEAVFEEISEYLLGSTNEIIERLFESINSSWNEIDGVILVGGSTRMRMIHKYIKEISGKEPLSGINVDEAVALGAAIRANMTQDGKPVAFLAKKHNSQVPTLKGVKTISDVTAHALGMISISQDGEEYINSTIIKKNTKIPASNTRSYNFRVSRSNNELEVYVLQGEYRRPLDNTVINKYVVYNIENTNSVNSVIDITYQYTIDGVVEVSATQKETGKKLPVRIEPVPDEMSWTDGSPKNKLSSGKTPSMEVILTVDLSGSMSGNPLKEAKKAMCKFVDELAVKGVKIGLIPFANKATCIVSPEDNYKRLKIAIDKLEIGDDYGYGNRAHPFDIAFGKLNRSKAALRYIIVLTDGMWSCSESAITSAKKCHKAGIEVLALGFGTADYNFLKKIASIDEFASITDIANLGESLSKIAQVIGEGTTGLTVI